MRIQPTSPEEPGAAGGVARPRWRDAWRVRHGREILRLATPTVLTMLSHTLMWTVDTAMLGHVSSLALAAAGLGGIMTWTGYSLFNNLSRITATFVAQAHGKGDDEAIAAYTWQGITIALCSGLILQLAGYLSHAVLPWTGHQPALQDLTYTYVKWRTASAVFTQLSFALMGFYQGRRDVKTPMWAGIAANLVNLILDVWLIFGWSGFSLDGAQFLAVPPLGVKGAAIATSVGQVINVAILIACLWRGENIRRYRIHRPRRPSWLQIRNIIRIGSPAAFENFIDMGAFTFFSIFIGRTGEIALATSQITIQLLAFSFMPMWGITIAGSVLTGNWIGAGKPEVAEDYGRQVYKVGIYYSLAVALILILAREHVFVIFSDDPAVLALGATLAVTAAIFQIADGLRMVAIGILQGAGDTRFPMYQSLIILWGLFVPLTYVLIVKMGAGVAGAWLGGTFCYILQAIFLYFRFRSGQWKKFRIFTPEDTAGSTD